MRAAAACALAAFAALAAYRGTLRNGFTWDDHIHVEAAPFVQDARNARVLTTSGFWTGRTAVEGSARPLLLASLLADRALWGERAAGYHLTSLLLHAACAAALAWLACLLTGSAGLGAIAGALFAVHPVQSEAVCEITFRADLLSALGVLLALAALRLALTRRSRSWIGASAAAFALALLAKETAVVFPALALLMEGLFPTGPGAGRSRRAAAVLFAAVLAAYAAFRIPRGGYAAAGFAATAVEAKTPHATTQFSESPPEWKASLVSPSARILTMSGILGDYARLTVWPAGLQADRSAPTVSSWASARPWAGWGVLLLLLAAAWAARAVRPAAAFGLCWFLIALAPVSGVVDLPNLIAERYLYLAVAGAAVAAAAALDAASRRSPHPRPVMLAAAAALLVPSAVATMRRVPAWRNDAALFGGPPATDSARLHYNLGLLAQQAGRLDDAAVEYRRASEMNPGSIETLVNLAAVEKLRGRGEEGLALLRRAVSATDSSPIAFNALGDALESAGRRDEALAAYKKAVGADGNWPAGRRSYARALARAGRFDEALLNARTAAELEPRSAAARYEVGRIAQEAGRLDDAVAAFRDAARLDPRDELAWENLGVSLHRSGDAASALEPLRRAVELRPDGASERRNLGVALDDLDRGAEAEDALAAAVRLDARYIDAWHALGVVRQKRGEKGAAEEAYRRAVALAPKRVESLSNLAGLYETDGRLDEAQALLETAMKADPRPAVLNNLGNIYRARGRFADAARLYELALGQNARYGDSSAAQAPTRVNLGLCWLALDRPDLAQGEARGVLDSRPDDAAARELLRRAEAALAARPLLK